MAGLLCAGFSFKPYFLFTGKGGISCNTLNLIPFAGVSRVNPPVIPPGFGLPIRFNFFSNIWIGIWAILYVLYLSAFH